MEPWGTPCSTWCRSDFCWRQKKKYKNVALHNPSSSGLQAVCLRGTFLSCYAAKSRGLADSKSWKPAKNPSKNSVAWPRNIADDYSSFVFEAIETPIIWKPLIVAVVLIVSKFVETIEAIGTIRTIYDRETGLNNRGDPVNKRKRWATRWC